MNIWMNTDTLFQDLGMLVTEFSEQNNNLNVLVY
jgi:hypothetical protein